MLFGRSKRSVRKYARKGRWHKKIRRFFTGKHEESILALIRISALSYGKLGKLNATRLAYLCMYSVADEHRLEHAYHLPGTSKDVALSTILSSRRYQAHIAALGVYVRTTIATTANNKHATRFV